MNYTANDLRKLADTLDQLGGTTRDTGVTIGVNSYATIGAGADAFPIKWDPESCTYLIDLEGAYR